MILTVPIALTLVGASALAAVMALIVMSSAAKGTQFGRNSLFDMAGGDCVFLFDETDLVDATDAAHALLANTAQSGEPWARLMAYITPRFSNFERRVAALRSSGPFSLVADGNQPLTLRAEWRGGLTRISLTDPRLDPGVPSLDALSINAMQEELDTLRSSLAHAPILVWREDAAGSVVWANDAYLRLAGKDGSPDAPLNWPLPKLFPNHNAAEIAKAQSTPRASVETTGKPLWFQFQAYQSNPGHIAFALPADAAVQAEATLRSFVQTLTKTFAHLTVGLAIFDRKRELALFNPALIDLTTLTPEFLSARPTLFAFLDSMRDRHMIPEPRDYRTWRKQMNALEKAASTGTYEETWTLPNGQTYRVTGRPHPDGAVAFLFEDISAEMTLTRRFRAELELGQAVIDTMQDALAVFSPAGAMILSNAAYAELWGLGTEEEVRYLGIAEAAQLWQSRSAPSPIWAEAQNYVWTIGPRETWKTEARLSDGRLLSCRFSPLAGGSTLACFSPMKPERQRGRASDRSPVSKTA